MVRSFTHVFRWGQKITFFHKLLKVILLNFIAIFADSEVEISCLKMISDLKKRRLLTFTKIEILSFLMRTLVFKI